MGTDPSALVAAHRAFLVAPAGCGKTELIAGAVQIGTGRSLVLTHTHGGVSALKSRLQRYGVPTSMVEVQTIAGWTLRFASAYPKTSGIAVSIPEGAAWSQVYDAGVRLLSASPIRRVLRESYAGVFVDEYQDCNLRQHEIVLALAEVLPCRLLGDPLQGIFDFAEPTIDWASDVAPHFDRLPDLDIPHRWHNHNPALGEWLMQVRRDLIAGAAIDLGSGPATWAQSSPANRRQACWEAVRRDDESTVAIGKWPSDCHEFASGMRGAFTSMEELDCRALMDFGRRMDAASDGERAAALIDFAVQCFTELKATVTPWRSAYESGRLVNTARLTANRRLAESLNNLANAGPGEWPRRLVAAIRVIERVQGLVLYRRELWREMTTTVLSFQSNLADSIEETAWMVRDRSRRLGRKSEHRVVSRTLLVKGLEFHGCIVLDADKLSSKELYVALTRGRSHLAVLSSSARMRYPVPSNIV